jgi:hypothetical protein
LRPVLLPLGLVTLFCVLVAVGGGPQDTPADMMLRFYGALAGAASAPPLLFGNAYARFAARAHERLGLGPAQPRLSRFRSRLWQLVRFALVVAVPIAPVLWTLGAVPFAGAAAAFLVGSAWTLHWVVVEALDGARVAGAPGAIPPAWPWFLVWAGRPGFADLPRAVRRPAAWTARRVRALTRPWHEEAALVAARPITSAGFGLAAAGLLAVPGLNLLFRPAVLVASVHLAARLRAPAAACAGDAGTAGGVVAESAHQ